MEAAASLMEGIKKATMYTGNWCPESSFNRQRWITCELIVDTDR